MNKFSRFCDVTVLSVWVKLKENILQAYRKQIRSRQALLEIDSGLMDVIHECTRNESIIEHYESNKENSPRNSKKSSEEITADTMASKNAVQRARGKLRILEQERSKLEKQRKTQLKDFETAKNDAHHLLEKVIKKLSSLEQRELLKLSTQNFEYEMKTIELQAEIFVRDYSIKHKDLQLLRMSQHRSLCDTLIYQQRRIIQEYQILVPSDLEELYQLYSRDIDEGQLIHDLKIHSPHSITNCANGKSSTLPFLSQIVEEDLISVSISITSFYLSNDGSKHNHLTTTTTTLPPHRILSDQDLFTHISDNSNTNELGQDLSSTINTLISYSHFYFEQSLKPQLIKGNSMVSLSSDSVDVPINRQVHTTSPSNDFNGELSPALFNNNNNNNNTMKSKGKLRKQTQDIAAKAAQQRADLHHREVMEDMGSVFSSEPIPSNDNTASAFGLEITDVKPKKTVTINDPAASRNRANDLYRRNSDSPDLALYDPFYSTTNNRTTKPQSKKRSLSHAATINHRSTIPIANMVVPREYY